MDDPTLPRDLADIAPWIDHTLARGAGDPRSAFHWPTLATVGEDGAPRMRTVVLRGYERAARRLELFTDRRSAKVAELAAQPCSAVHVHDPKKRVQLRLRGQLTIHTSGPLWDAAWDRARQGPLDDYSRVAPPGTALGPGEDAAVDHALAPRNFAVLSFNAQEADYLHLAAEAHRRAHLTLAGPAGVEARWLVP